MTDSWKRAEDWLRQNAEYAVRSLFPDGKKVGNDWVVGSLNGEKGQSLHIAVAGDKIGAWIDYATSDKGSRLLELWRRRHGFGEKDHEALFNSLRTFSSQDFGRHLNSKGLKPNAAGQPEPPPDPPKKHAPINWDGCVQALDVRAPALYRGWPLP